jgi:hypothetical protein
MLVSPGRAEGMDKVRAVVSKVQDPTLRLAYLFGAIVTQDDPVLKDELASTDPVRVTRAQGLLATLRRNLQGALDLRKIQEGQQPEFDVKSPKAP